MSKILRSAPSLSHTKNFYSVLPSSMLLSKIEESSDLLAGTSHMPSPMKTLL